MCPPIILSLCDEKSFYLLTLIASLLIADTEKVIAYFVFTLIMFTLSHYAVSVFVVCKIMFAMTLMNIDKCIMLLNHQRVYSNNII